MNKKGGHKICQMLALLGPPYSEDVHFNAGVEGDFSILILIYLSFIGVSNQSRKSLP